MKKIRNYIKEHWFGIGVSFIVLLAAFLRFYDYANRWGLAYDQAHDVIIARYALTHFKLPLLGPFSSAGPFQTGGEWYWFIMLGSLLFPFWINGPWIFLTIVSIIFIVVMILIANELISKQFGLILGLIAAISPSEISQATNLTNQAPISILSALTILTMIFYIKKRSSLSIFFLGFLPSLAMSIHMQGATLFAIVVFTLLLARPTLKQALLLVIGIIVPLSPMFFAELHYNFFNTKGFLQYYLHDQYRIPLEMLGRRWSTYIGILWPTTIANAIGGLIPMGYIIAALWFCLIPSFYIRKKRELYWIILPIVFLTFVIALRYVHTPLFDSYFMFVHPFIFIFTALSLYILLSKKKYKILGIGLLVVFMLGSFFQINQIIEKSDNWTNHLAISWYNLLNKDYPREQFSLYDYQYQNSSRSFPLVLYLQFYNKISSSGVKIAMGAPLVKIDPVTARLFQSIKHNNVGFLLLDASSSSSAQLGKMIGYISIQMMFIMPPKIGT